jgi:hypothetical protein
MDEIVHLPGPPVKLRPEEARLKWLFGAVRLTSVFSGTEVTADAAMDSYKRPAAVIRAPDICRSKRLDEQIGQKTWALRQAKRLNAGMVALPTDQSGPDPITAAQTTPIAARFIGVLRAPHHLIPRDLINVRFGTLCGLKSNISRGPRSARLGHSGDRGLQRASVEAQSVR